MRSIKPGRGPSMMGGVMGIFAAVFGIIWTGAAVSMGAPVFFALFGIIFIAIAIFNTVYNFKNATGENRYSLYDITEHGEEEDPLNARFGADSPAEKEAEKEVKKEAEQQRNSKDNRFCPYCGAELQSDFVYCNSCGRKLP